MLAPKIARTLARVAATLRTRALVLRSIDYGESDRILTLLTEHQGKVAVIVRHARASRRRFAGSLEPFCVLRVELSHGRGELARLVTAVVDCAFVRLLGSLDQMREAGAALSAIRDLLPDRQPEPELFAAVVVFFAAVDGPDSEAPRQFKLALVARALSLLGFGPQLVACGECGRVATRSHAVQLHASRGQILCRACGGASIPLAARSRALLLAILGPGWEQAARARWPKEQLDQIAYAIRCLLENCLEREVGLM